MQFSSKWREEEEGARRASKLFLLLLLLLLRGKKAAGKVTLPSSSSYRFADFSPFLHFQCFAGGKQAKGEFLIFRTSAITSGTFTYGVDFFGEAKLWALISAPV